MHPAEEIRGRKGSSLEGKTIVLGVTGSIAAVKTVELARELIRHSAEVIPAMTRDAGKIIGEQALEYATGKKPITEITGMVENVTLLGGKGNADLLLIAPCTANIIGKISQGIADDTISTMAMTAIGAEKKVIIAPSMHAPMWENPIFKENLEKLEKNGVIILQPRIVENVAKFPSKKEIVLACERALVGKRLQGKKVLVVSGRTEDDVNGIRILTSRASGKTGRLLALEAFRQGAEVKIIHNDFLRLHSLEKISEEKARTTTEFYEKTVKELGKGHDWLLLPAAIGDFEASMLEGKIISEKKASIELKPREKLLEIVGKKFPGTKIVAFKAVVGASKEELLEIAKEKLRKEKLQIVVANDVREKGMGTSENSVWIVSGKTEKWVSADKKEIAREIVQAMS